MSQSAVSFGNLPMSLRRNINDAMHRSPALEWPNEGICDQHYSETSGMSWSFLKAIEWRDNAFAMLREYNDNLRRRGLFSQRDDDVVVKGIRTISRAYDNDAQVTRITEEPVDLDFFDYYVSAPYRDLETMQVRIGKYGVRH